MLDYDALIAPIADDAPCGPDLRGEPDFRDIEDAPAGFADQKRPELAQVVARCEEFLARTKDHMPLVVALQAALRMGDFATANAALTLIKGFAEDYWEDFHPAPADEMLIARVNELSALTKPGAMVLPLGRAALATMPMPSTQIFTAAMVGRACEPVPEWSSDDEEALATRVEAGQITATAAKGMRPAQEGARALRMIVRVLSADARAGDREADTEGEAFEMDAEQARRLALDLRGQIETARGELSAMSDLLYEVNEAYDRRGGDSPSFGPVLSQLKTMVGEADRFLATFPEDVPVEEAGADAGAADGPAGAAGAVGGAVRPFVAGALRSRDDVRASLDAICRFYAEHEPSSPVPLVLKRARTWIDKDFLELLDELAPDGVADAQRVLAIRETDEDDSDD